MQPFEQGLATKDEFMRDKIYYAWRDMKARCFNPNNKSYVNYGARGISVCSEWRDSFEAFLFWATNNGYEEGLTLDRIDNDGNYEPSNCKWATRKEQQRNRRNTRFLNAFGETKPITEWVEDSRCVVERQTLDYRLKLGIGVEQAMTTPSRNLGTLRVHPY